MLYMKGADPDQPAIGADQSGTAPKRVSGRGKDRAIEHVLPIAGKFLASDNPRGDRMAPPAFGGHDGAIARADAHPDPEIDRWGVQPSQRLDQTETGFLVVGEHMTRNSAALGGCKPDRLRFRNQIANRQNEAISADQNAAAGAFGAERRRGEGVFRDRRLQSEHRRQRAVHVKREVLALWLELARYFPFNRSRHGPGLLVAGLSL